MINHLNLVKHIKYLRAQKVNLRYPNEQYIASVANINKADLHRFNYIYGLHKNLRGKMLDIGCNDGFLMRHYPWKFQRFLGIDIFSISQYTKGKYWFNRKYYTKDFTIRYKQGYFEDIASKLEKFDFIFAGEIIEHVQNPDVFIKSLKSTLKPKARWCISTPNSIGKDLPEHNRQFSKKTLTYLLTKYFKDFRIVELKSPGDSWPFLIVYGTTS